MHMSDSLVSFAVGTTMAAVSTGAVGYSIRKIKKTDLDNSKIPMMGVMGAFVFAAQMINFTIPGTGSSGHIGGGILLAALLGPYPAFITLTSVLIIQALFFADGGLLALGCNIFNMGFLTCFIAYPFIYRQILKKSVTPKRIALAAILAVVIGLQLGSFSVVVETTASGVTELPFRSLLIWMQPIHLAIGIIEGVITGAVLSFVYKSRKEIIMNSLEKGTQKKISMKRVLVIFAIAAIFIGGFLSYFASSNPDGLEWAIQGITQGSEIVNSSKTHLKAQELQENTAILPHYSFDGEAQDSVLGTSVSGVIGGIVTLVVTIVSGLVIMKIKKNKGNRVVTDK
ncbi:MAG: energy-coupling factor ABC transporter permease [Herbinix sp.]|nr:energy-coupling factor ABC transporter permease [Herbinix sp.]